MYVGGVVLLRNFPLVGEVRLTVLTRSRERAIHKLFGSHRFVQTELARKWGHIIARGWVALLLDRLRDFVVVPSSAGGNSSLYFVEALSEHGGAYHF
jgi:hypothetical protein